MLKVLDRNARSAMAIQIYDIVVREFPEATIDDTGADPVVTAGEHSITLEPDCFHCTGPYRARTAIDRDWLRRVALKVAGAL